jgi:ParB family chromosome partitioning protein
MARNLASEALRRRAGQTLERVQVESTDLVRTRHPVEYLHVDTLVPWAEQPRRDFDADALAVFAQEILEHGVNHALVIRAVGDQRVIVAGERRWRASRIAGESNPSRLFVPCVVREMTDAEAHTVAILENVQREDLSPYEFASAVARLCQIELGVSQEQLVRSLTQHYNRRDDEAREVTVLNRVLGRMGGRYARLAWKSFTVNYLPMLRYPDVLVDALQRGVAYTKVTLLLKLTSEDAQRQALRTIEDQGLSLEATKALVASMLKSTEIATSREVRNAVQEAKRSVRMLTPQRWSTLSVVSQERALALMAELQLLLSEKP